MKVARHARWTLVPVMLLAGCLAEHIAPTSQGSLWYCADDRVQTEERLNRLAEAIGATVTFLEVKAPLDDSETYYFQDIGDGQMVLNMFIRRDGLVYHYYRRGNEGPEDEAQRVQEIEGLFHGSPGGCESKAVH